MNSDDLIANLSRRPPREGRLPPTAAIVCAALISLGAALMLSMLWLKPRSDLAIPLIVDNHVFLLKLGFAVSVIMGALPIVRDLSIPGRRVGLGSPLTAAPFVMVIVLAVHELADRHFGALSYLGDHSVLQSLWQIPVLAVPAVLILAGVVRSLGPTNLRLTGAYVGLLAGGIGALGYALHCHHDSVAFVGVAYTLAILETAVLGALVGPRILRWT